jgi:hypothetical protein
MNLHVGEKTVHFLFAVALVSLFSVVVFFNWPAEVTGATVRSTPQCVVPDVGMVFSDDVVLCTGQYELRDGIHVVGDNVLLDCDGAVLMGDGLGTGVTTKGTSIVIKDCIIKNFLYGISIPEGSESVLDNTKFSGNSENIVHL